MKIEVREAFFDDGLVSRAPSGGASHRFRAAGRLTPSAIHDR